MSMTKLPILLTLLTVACGGADFTSEPVTVAEAGSAGSAGAATVQAGSGGSSSAGRGGSAQGGSSSTGGSAGAATAGSGGEPAGGAGGQAAVCENPSVTLPTTFTFESWHYENAGECATLISTPVTCQLTWQEDGWIDNKTYQAHLESTICGDGSPQPLTTGACGAETECSFDWLSANWHIGARFVFGDNGIESVLTQKDAAWVSWADYPATAFYLDDLFDHTGCTSAPEFWANRLMGAMSWDFWAFLQALPVTC